MTVFWVMLAQVTKRVLIVMGKMPFHVQARVYFGHTRNISIQKYTYTAINIIITIDTQTQYSRRTKDGASRSRRRSRQWEGSRCVEWLL